MLVSKIVLFVADVRAECDVDMTTTDAEEDISSMATAGSKRQRNQIRHPDFVNYSDGTYFTISAEIIQIFQCVVNCRTQKNFGSRLTVYTTSGFIYYLTVIHLLCSPKHADMSGIKSYCFGSGGPITKSIQCILIILHPHPPLTPHRRCPCESLDKRPE